MNNKNLINKIKVLNPNEKLLVVLQGFDLHDLNLDVFQLCELLKTKKSTNWIKLQESNRNIISFDEFLYFYNYALDDYDQIIVLKNNLYINFYPIYKSISDTAKKILLKHFSQESIDFDNIDTEKDSITYDQVSDYTKIYSNLIEINSQLFATYDESAILEKANVQIIPFYDTKINKEINKLTEIKSENIINIETEIDFLEFLSNENTFNKAIFYDNFEGNTSLLEEKLNIINTYKKPIFTIKKLEYKNKIIKNKNSYIEILNKHWGKKTFRELKIYDFSKIQENKKVINQVSQIDIINDIVTEVEKCITSTDVLSDQRDIFVTAPTGSGKSAMFQIPAIHIAQEYGLLTLVISPLIGLMNDQVYNLQKSNYQSARTINSDMSPIQKEQIINEIKENKCHILYLSPESLLAKGNITQLIGERKIGLIVIDEAHIVTTWGKQFRPDYWFLGDHIKQLRKAQAKMPGGHSFPITTFTATAIYGGIEDMYKETVNGLYLKNPITYLGYVKRDDINIHIKLKEKNTNKTEYQKEKFEDLLNLIQESILTNKKTLIYFPTVRLIDQFGEYCNINNLSKYISTYHGQLPPDKKQECYESFRKNEKIIMLATKAFGMGIDINDIEIVAHFAPTGNVCDYVQEIGRAARAENLIGNAKYSHMSNDFKHINKLHGLSAIKKYQLVQVIEKVYEIFINKINNSTNDLTKKRNSMLVDAESFTYIFDNGLETDENTLINKVKTAMLLIQKDFINKMNFSPFMIKPIPLFSKGFFKIDNNVLFDLQKVYPVEWFELKDRKNKIYSVDLGKIWDQEYKKFSYGKFKFLLYSKSNDLDFNLKYPITQALCIDICFQNDNKSSIILNSIFRILRKSVAEEKFLYIEEQSNKSDESIAQYIKSSSNSTSYKSNMIASVLLASIDNYKRNSYTNRLNGHLYFPKQLNSGDFKYKFNPAIEDYINWVQKSINFIENNVIDGKLYLINENNNSKIFQEYLSILGLLESIGKLTFKALGGENSQIYIYVNQTKTMQQIKEKPYKYENNLLKMVGDRHKISVAMMSYLFQNSLTSEDIWNYIEDYFLGIVPEIVAKNSGLKI